MILVPWKMKFLSKFQSSEHSLYYYTWSSWELHCWNTYHNKCGLTFESL